MQGWCLILTVFVAVSQSKPVDDQNECREKRRVSESKMTQIKIQNEFNTETFHDLLREAPLAVRLLGDMLIKTVETGDIKLSGGDSSIRNPDSLKKTLMQVSNTATDTFLASLSAMNKISTTAQAINKRVNKASKLVAEGLSKGKNRQQFNKFIEGALRRSSKTKVGVNKASAQFEKLIDLIQDLIESVQSTEKSLQKGENNIDLEEAVINAKADLKSLKEYKKLLAAEEQKVEDFLDVMVKRWVAAMRLFVKTENSEAEARAVKRGIQFINRLRNRIHSAMKKGIGSKSGEDFLHSVIKDHIVIEFNSEVDQLRFQNVDKVKVGMHLQDLRVYKALIGEMDIAKSESGKNILKVIQESISHLESLNNNAEADAYFKTSKYDDEFNKLSQSIRDLLPKGSKESFQDMEDLAVEDMDNSRKAIAKLLDAQKQIEKQQDSANKRKIELEKLIENFRKGGQTKSEVEKLNVVKQFIPYLERINEEWFDAQDLFVQLNAQIKTVIKFMQEESLSKESFVQTSNEIIARISFMKVVADGFNQVVKEHILDQMAGIGGVIAVKSKPALRKQSDKLKSKYDTAQKSVKVYISESRDQYKQQLEDAKDQLNSMEKCKSYLTTILKVAYLVKSDRSQSESESSDSSNDLSIESQSNESRNRVKLQKLLVPEESEESSSEDNKKNYFQTKLSKSQEEQLEDLRIESSESNGNKKTYFQTKLTSAQDEELEDIEDESRDGSKIYFQEKSEHLPSRIRLNKIKVEESGNENEDRKNYFQTSLGKSDKRRLRKLQPRSEEEQKYVVIKTSIPQKKDQYLQGDRHLVLHAHSHSESGSDDHSSGKKKNYFQSKLSSSEEEYIDDIESDSESSDSDDSSSSSLTNSERALVGDSSSSDSSDSDSESESDSDSESHSYLVSDEENSNSKENYFQKKLSSSQKDDLSDLKDDMSSDSDDSSDSSDSTNFFQSASDDSDSNDSSDFFQSSSEESDDSSNFFQSSSEDSNDSSDSSEFLQSNSEESSEIGADNDSSESGDEVKKSDVLI